MIELKRILRTMQGFFLNIIYAFPANGIKIIGVTGSEGKTTTVAILYELFQSIEKKVGMINTIEAKIGDESFPTGLHVTTPDLPDLYKILKKMKESKVEYLILETTSHALDQNRVAGLKYDVAVYTNVTWEHLDYHKTYDKYLSAKSILIDKTKKTGMVILNKDDKSYDFLIKKAVFQNKKVFSYSLLTNNSKIEKIKSESSENSLIAKNIFSNEPEKNIEFEIESLGKFKLNIPGEYNISNLLATFSVMKLLGLENWEKYRQRILSINQNFIKGRWNIIQKKPFWAIVDFAHSPNALEKMLKIACEMKKKNGSGRIIIVFGSAGERDREKRPVMGEITSKYADIVIITAEDPRTEKLEDINKAIEQGVLKISGRVRDENYYVIPDRREAIFKAVEIAEDQDILIVTGKGHEQSMALMQADGIVKETPWDDENTLREALGKVV